MKKTIMLGTAMAAALMISACSSKPAETPTTVEATTAAVTTEAAATEAAGAYKAGTYTATAKGYGGDVTVTVTIDAGKITDVKIDGPDETEGLGSKAVEGLPAAIKDAQSADVDAVAGATVTSDAIKEALTDALSQASAE